MGLFDFLGKKNDTAAAPKKGGSRDIARLARLAGEKMAQDYDRQEAIQELSKMGTAEAAEALLRRFAFTMEPSITDHEEKESAVEGIVAAGKAAIEPIRRYAARAESLTWPLKVLKRIVPEEQMVDELLALLDQFDTEYMRNPEPKLQLISVLEEYKNDAVRAAVEPFLTDVNEPVRFHAAGTVFAMDNAESVAALVEALGQEESLRVKNRIAQGLSERRWTVPEAHVAACRDALPPGFSVSGGVVQRHA
ncbi:MAG TPA: HEAT repeat domain-containing protein [Polyangiaceae bacterium]|nr:HEAT repeat domain-containing protein [Polyangiaceae bacterium]